MGLKIEVVGEIWVKRVRGQGGEVELYSTAWILTTSNYYMIHSHSIYCIILYMFFLHLYLSPPLGS